MKKILQGYLLYVAVIVLLVGFALLYVNYVRPVIEPTYYGNPPAWMKHVLDTFYPRFETEKNRFPLEFFTEKADQCVWRAFFVGILFCIINIIYNINRTLRSEVVSFWRNISGAANLMVLRILFYGMSFTLFYDWFWQLRTLGKIKEFYKPILFLDVLGISYPSDLVLFTLFFLLGLSALLMIINLFPLISSFVFAAMFVLFQGLLFSFEKIDHGYATFTYAAILFPFLIYEERKSAINNTKNVSMWPVQLIKLTICLCYFMSGLEKLFVSGITWPVSGTLQAYLFHYHTHTGLLAATSDGFCTAASIFTLVFQLGFILILVLPRYSYIFILTGILFHFGVVVLFGFSAFWNPWIMTYIFFFDWSKLHGYFLKYQPFVLSKEDAHE